MKRIMLLTCLLLGLQGCSESTVEQAAVADNEQVQNRGANKDNWWDALPREAWSAFARVPQAQEWFEVYEVADGVFAIYEPGQFEEVISFLITGNERAVLFDTGLGIGDMRQVVEELTERDVIVVNSHSHYDHIGGNHQFDTVYSSGTPYSLERAKGSTPEAVAGFFTEGWVWKPLPDGIDKTRFRSEPFSITKTIEDGEVIDLGGRQLEVVMVPGHAPDALTLLDRENRIIFTGDTFYLAPLYTHLEGSDFDRYLQSANKLASMADAYDHAFTAHNVPVVDGDYLVAMADAFNAIRDGSVSEYTVTDGNRQYFFDGFSVIVDPEDVN